MNTYTDHPCAECRHLYRGLELPWCRMSIRPARARCQWYFTTETRDRWLAEIRAMNERDAAAASSPTPGTV